MDKKGFTLIEIITVIAIIAIVLVIASPSIFNFKNRANEKALNSKIELLSKNIENYVEKNSNDIIYKCANHDTLCICSSFTTNANGYTCTLKVQKLLDLELYSETCNKQDSSECTCKIVNPTNNTADYCLENRYFSININPDNNTANATFIE